MAMAVDSSVLIDVLVPEASGREAAIEALEVGADEGLIVCEIVIAEVHPVLVAGSIEEFLEDWEIQFVPCSLQSSALAGRNFAQYLARGGKRGRVVPDFLIAAHAQTHASALLTRDAGFARDYFKSLKIISP